VAFTVDPSPSGGDFFDVFVESPLVNISLILQSGVEVNASNAAGLGYGFSTAQVSSPGKIAISIVGRVGNHVFITFPASQAAGTYTMKADASALTADSAMNIAYLSSSSVRAGVTADAPLYTVGDTVVLSGILLDGGVSAHKRDRHGTYLADRRNRGLQSHQPDEYGNHDHDRHGWFGRSRWNLYLDRKRHERWSGTEHADHPDSELTYWLKRQWNR
jgi:hypothetical protein